MKVHLITNWQTSPSWEHKKFSAGWEKRYRFSKIIFIEAFQNYVFFTIWHILCHFRQVWKKGPSGAPGDCQLSTKLIKQKAKRERYWCYHSPHTDINDLTTISLASASLLYNPSPMERILCLLPACANYYATFSFQTDTITAGWIEAACNESLPDTCTSNIGLYMTNSGNQTLYL